MKKVFVCMMTLAILLSGCTAPRRFSSMSTPLSTETEPAASQETDPPEENTAADYITAEAQRIALDIEATRTDRSVVFPVLSDFHLFSGNSDHDASLSSAQYAGMGIAALSKYTKLDLTAFLGDYSWQSTDYQAEQVIGDIALAREAVEEIGTEIWCVGNHDLNYGDGRDRLLSTDELYTHIGGKSDGTQTSSRCYGYLDLEPQKIRIIHLNTCDTSDWDAVEGEAAQAEWISPTQIQWLADTALNFSDKTSPREWGIVIVGHHPLHYGYKCFGRVMKLLEAYRDGLSGTLSCPIKRVVAEDGTQSYPMQDVHYDFTSGERAEIICNIHGHDHNCGYSQISSSSWKKTDEVEPWLWRLCIPNICAGRYNTGAQRGESYGEYDSNGNPVQWEKQPDSAAATSFCVVQIDRDDQTVTVHIFGAGKSRTIQYGTRNTQ